jgi:hypothetical protein
MRLPALQASRFDYRSVGTPPAQREKQKREGDQAASGHPGDEPSRAVIVVEANWDASRFKDPERIVADPLRPAAVAGKTASTASSSTAR